MAKAPNGKPVNVYTNMQGEPVTGDDDIIAAFREMYEEAKDGECPLQDEQILAAVTAIPGSDAKANMARLEALFDLAPEPLEDTSGIEASDRDTSAMDIGASFSSELVSTLVKVADDAEAFNGAPLHIAHFLVTERGKYGENGEILSNTEGEDKPDFVLWPVPGSRHDDEDYNRKGSNLTPDYRKKGSFYNDMIAGSSFGQTVARVLELVELAIANTITPAQATELANYGEDAAAIHGSRHMQTSVKARWKNRPSNAARKLRIAVRFLQQAFAIDAMPKVQWQYVVGERDSDGLPSADLAANSVLKEPLFITVKGTGKPEFIKPYSLATFNRLDVPEAIRLGGKLAHLAGTVTRPPRTGKVLPPIESVSELSEYLAEVTSFFESPKAIGDLYAELSRQAADSDPLLDSVFALERQLSKVTNKPALQVRYREMQEAAHAVAAAEQLAKKSA